MHALILVAAAAISPLPQGKVDLQRVFKDGAKATYEFNSRIQVDFRMAPLETFIPETDGFTYTFTTSVEKVKPDGVADIRFKRPKIVLKMGEKFDSAPKDEVLLKDQNVLYTLSHRNQVLAVKDETPKPPPKKDGGGMFWRANFGASQDIIIAWISQLRQIAAFVNFFDLGPILPNHPVAVGDTWKETVGYAPVTVASGADKGKNINARIDYVYTFMGKTDLNGKQVYHIVGKVDQDTDAAPYIADILGVKMDRAPFKEIKLKINGSVNYYLDTANLQPLEIRATSDGEVDVIVPDYPSGPVYEEKFKSRASLIKKS